MPASEDVTVTDPLRPPLPYPVVTLVPDPETDETDAHPPSWYADEDENDDLEHEEDDSDGDD